MHYLRIERGGHESSYICIYNYEPVNFDRPDN